MSTPAKRPPLAPRLVILAGGLTLFAANFLKTAPATQAVLQIGGGLVALAGLVWFFLMFRRR